MCDLRRFEETTFWLKMPAARERFFVSPRPGPRRPKMIGDGKKKIVLLCGCLGRFAGCLCMDAEGLAGAQERLATCYFLSIKRQSMCQSKQQCAGFGHGAVSLSRRFRKHFRFRQEHVRVSFLQFLQN